MEYLVLIPKQLAVVLKSRRKSLNLTQTEAGERVGLLPKTISLLESHPERCSLESLYKLVSALNLEISLTPKPSQAIDRSKGAW